MSRFVCVLAMIFAWTLPVQGDDWPQWRGPTRTGYAPGAKLPKNWPANPPEPKWSKKIGLGYSGPVVAQGKVFILAREAATGKEACLAFDAENGTRLWRHGYFADFTPPDATAGKGPNSTPTVDGDRVYMFGLAGMLHCLEIDSGKVLWERDCMKDFWGVKKEPCGDDSWFPPCGSAASPLVLGNHVILPLGGEKAGAFTAFDRNTGDIVWKALSERGSYCSPQVADLAGAKQIVGFTGLRMLGLGLDTKEILWDHPFPANFDQTILTPVLWKDHVILGGEQRPTVSLKIQKQAGKLVATQAWQSKDLRCYMSTPVVVKDHLVGLDNRLKKLVCLDLATGQTKWSSEVLSNYASIVSTDDYILALANDGNLLVMKADVEKYEPVVRWKMTQAGGTWAHLAVAGSLLVIKDREHLMCFDLRKLP